MSEAHERVWLSVRHEEHLVSVADGEYVKGPGEYYVPADVHDETKRQRDILLETCKVMAKGLKPGDPGSALLPFVIAECERAR